MSSQVSRILAQGLKGLLKLAMAVVMLSVKMILLCLAGTIHFSIKFCIIQWWNFPITYYIEAYLSFYYRLATVASGAASGKLLQYEVGGPKVSVQTAYGVEVEVGD